MGTKKKFKPSAQTKKKALTPVKFVPPPKPTPPTPPTKPTQPTKPEKVHVPKPMDPGNYDVTDVLNLRINKIIDMKMTLDLLGLPQAIVTESHPVAVRNLGNIGTLQLYADGRALFVPEHPMADVKTFDDTKLTFTITPESLKIEEGDAAHVEQEPDGGNTVPFSKDKEDDEDKVEDENLPPENMKH